MPRYELVLDGVLSEGSMAGQPGFSWTTEGATTVLRTMLSQRDLARVLETLESLGLGLVSLRQVDAAGEDSSRRLDNARSSTRDPTSGRRQRA